MSGKEEQRGTDYSGTRRPGRVIEDPERDMMDEVEEKLEKNGELFEFPPLFLPLASLALFLSLLTQLGLRNPNRIWTRADRSEEPICRLQVQPNIRVRQTGHFRPMLERDDVTGLQSGISLPWSNLLTSQQYSRLTISTE